METKKQSRFILFSELLHRQFRGADHRNANLSALWDEAGCSGRQNETPLFRSAAQERRFFFCRIRILSFFCRLFLSFKERKTAVLVEGWRLFRGLMAVDSKTKKRPACRQPPREKEQKHGAFCVVFFHHSSYTVFTIGLPSRSSSGVSPAP